MYLSLSLSLSLYLSLSSLSSLPMPTQHWREGFEFAFHNLLRYTKNLRRLEMTLGANVDP